MKTTYEARYIGVSIGRPPDEVYAFASDPRNIVKWATGLGESIEQVDGEWVARGPVGAARVTVAEPNEFGVLDHDVFLESGEKVHNAIRVVPNARGSEVIFVLLRRPGISDEEFMRDAAWVHKDLGILKALMEGERGDNG